MDYSNFVSWMSERGLIEGKTGLLKKRGMDEGSTKAVFELLEKYGFIEDSSNFVFAYSGVLRSRNSYYNAVMLITKQQFIFVNYDNPRDVFVGIYNKSNIDEVTTVESQESTIIRDLAIITKTLDDPEHIYAIHVGNRLNEIGDVVIKCISDMEDANYKYGLFRIGD